MAKKNVVELTAQERQELKEITSKNNANRAKIINAFVLLKADSGPDGENWTDEAIAEAYDISIPKIERTRRRFVKEGLAAALNRKTVDRSHRRKIQGEEEAHLIAISCGSAPEGRSRWPLRLLADRMVELNIVENISHETVRQALKKMNLSLGKTKSGVFPRKPMPNLSVRWKKS